MKTTFIAFGFAVMAAIAGSSAASADGARPVTYYGDGYSSHYNYGHSDYGSDRHYWKPSHYRWHKHRYWHRHWHKDHWRYQRYCYDHSYSWRCHRHW
ncbi:MULTISPECIES: hypothetical protein [Rhodomicrobium]|uniref:hypothetical protein n=1 Tax=Rhodomicrobium TaxID=1068 RepID=UPI000B4AD5C2|nr:MULTISPECIES: hypothetical protein [Rhodomicrobium]